MRSKIRTERSGSAGWKRGTHRERFQIDYNVAATPHPRVGRHDSRSYLERLADSGSREQRLCNLQRKWKDGDRFELRLPMPMRLEAIDREGTRNPDTVALVRGRLVLFALTDETPKVTRDQLLTAKQIKGQPLWMAQTANGPLLLTPFTEINEENCRTYMTVT